MPRYLIRVKEVSMTGAFWVKASWLQSHILSKKNEQQKVCPLSFYVRIGMFCKFLLCVAKRFVYLN